MRPGAPRPWPSRPWRRCPSGCFACFLPCLTRLSAALRRQFRLRQGLVLRTRGPEIGTVESDSDAPERAQQRLRQRLRNEVQARRLGPATPALAGWRLLGAHPRDREMGPERALLGLVEPRLHQPPLDTGL